MKKLLSVFLAWIAVISLSLPALASSYADIREDAWYAEAVEALREKGMMSGVGSNRFAPDAIFTRASLAAVLYNMAGRPAVTGEDDFSDTDSGAWYTDAILWASQSKVVSGIGGGLFAPNSAATQEQLVTMLWNDAGAYAPDRARYTSAEGVENRASAWAFDAVLWGRTEGLLTDAVAFEPQKEASRAQVADMIFRYLKRKEQPADVDAVSGATQGADGQSVDTPEEETGSRVLVAYFSATGNTAKIAAHIADATGAALYQITPETPYTSNDLNYSDSSTRATREQNDPAARPAISGEAENMADCDVVFLGYPIWWGQAPKILYTFVESYDLAGKTIVPFCTSGSSSIGSSAANLQKSAAEADWLPGSRFSGSASRDSVVRWLNGLGLEIEAK